MGTFPRCRVLDLMVHRVTFAAVMDEIDELIRTGQPHQVVTVNMDFLRIAHHDAEFRDVVNAAALAVPDGIPVIWLSRLLGEPLGERVTGVDIIEHGAALAAERGYRIFLLGDAEGVADGAAATLRRRYPGLTVAGTYAPPFGPFSPAEERKMIDVVRQARPHMLFVAFGAPRQDVWISRHLDELGVPVCAGVGGSFNFFAGRVPRAPGWMQRAGLEWAFRLRQEPRRLWRRYLLGDLPLFVRAAVGAAVGRPIRRLASVT